jgi:plastocyanin
MRTEMKQSKLLNLLVLPVAVGMMAQAGDISGKVNGGKGIAVVYVEAQPGKTYPAPEKAPVIDQKKLQFQPHVLAVPVGSTVEFLNSDNLAHNIFWPAVNNNKKLGHNLGTWPTGQKRAFKFETVGVVPLLCNVHPEMSGFIIVTPTPYYAESDETGAYKIENVPNGSYTVSAWREGMKISSQQVTVSGSAKLDFSLSK